MQISQDVFFFAQMPRPLFLPLYTVYRCIIRIRVCFIFPFNASASHKTDFVLATILYAVFYHYYTLLCLLLRIRLFVIFSRTLNFTLCLTRNNTKLIIKYCSYHIGIQPRSILKLVKIHLNIFYAKQILY